MSNPADIANTGSARQSVVSQLDKLIGKSTSRLSKQQSNSIKKLYWVPTFTRPVKFSTSGRIDQSLPSSGSDKPLCVQLATGIFDSVYDIREQEVLSAFYLIAVRDAMRGGHSLPNIFADRFSDPHPNCGDLLLFEIFDDAFSDVVKSRNLESDELAEWNSMASATNPACRLLSLKLFRRVEKDQVQWIHFYAQYRDERSPEIIEELVRQLFESAQPGAIPLLEDLKNNRTVKSSAPLSTRILQTKSDMITIINPYHENQ